MEYLSSGTLLKRMKVCGNPRCHCASDPAARHGPYFEWSYLKGGQATAPHAHARAGRHHAARDRQPPKGQEVTAGLGGSDPAPDRTQDAEIASVRRRPAEITPKCVRGSAECKSLAKTATY